MTELWRLPATEIAAMVRGKAVSAIEVAESALARLDAVNPAINAVVESRRDEAIAAARRIDRSLAQGGAVGPLAGVPITTKINVDHAGYATSNGVRTLKDNIAHVSNPVVDNLLRADAVMIGRTNAPAFSYRWFTSNLLHGATRNPHDPRLTPGGSSGGAAASVATGIAAIAHGTDIAGSIRYPAYACGIHGLRPTPGRVPAFNASLPEREIGPQLTAVSGPLARTVGDLRLALAAMSQADPRDPWWVPAPLEGPDVTRRAALWASPAWATDETVIRAVRKAGSALADAGWQVEEAPPPSLDEAAALQTTLWLGDGYAAKRAAAEADGDPGAIAILRGHEPAARGLDFATFSAALTRRATLVRDWLLFLDRYPVVLMPVSGELPFEDQLDTKDAASLGRVWRAQTAQIAIPFLGLPALTVSTGFEGRTPVGVQLVASRFREDLCLDAGDAIAAGCSIQPMDPCAW